MNEKEVIKELENGKRNFLTQTRLFHNMQEIVQKNKWLEISGYLQYEKLCEAGMTENQYHTLLQTQHISVIAYLVKDEQELKAAFKRMEEWKEIYSPVPIRIAIQSDNYKLEEIPLRYRWIKGMEFANFAEENQEEMLDWLARTESMYISYSPVVLDTTFYDKTATYLSFLHSMKWKELSFDDSLYFGGFFRTLLLSKELYHSVMLGYDFVEFMLSMVHYYYKAQVGEKAEEARKILEYKEHAVEILRLSKNTARGNELRQGKIHTNETLLELHDKIKKYYGISVVGEEYNFLGLIDVLQKIRNRTRGHGVILGKSGLALWDILFIYILILVYFLDVENFVIEVREDKVFAGYKDQKLICLSPFVIAQSDVPCMLHQIKGKSKKEYINYFYGEYAVPDYE